MVIDKERYSRFLERVAQDMDIPPAKHQQAVDRYQAVGKWLEGGVYPGCDGELSIYPQGSFRLGTVVRPMRGGAEADYDIDLVCELPILKDWTEPRSVKAMVGDRLREHQRYRKMLDTEGKRCWTLEYREQDGIGFHLDVLPAVRDHRQIDDTSIAITDKQEAHYHWSASDPLGYARWFDDKNRGAFIRVMMEQKKSILNHNLSAYLSVDDVPNQLVRTPLQRTIQIMKRHRDLYGVKATNGYRPISMIIHYACGVLLSKST